MRLVRSHSSLAFLATLTLSACASNLPIVSDSAARDPYVISMDEILSRPFASVYEAVETLRPQWMRERSPRTRGGPIDIPVFLDRVEFGTIQSLLAVPVETVERIEWVDAATAKERWGKGHSKGVIAVSTRR